MMNIHLSRPGGQREGPFTLEEINRDLAANKYRETDYWAWYEGLTEWVPLHQVPGIVRSRVAEPPGAAPTGDVPEYVAGDTEIIHSEEATVEEPASEETGSEEPTSAETPSEEARSQESPSEEQQAEETVVQPESEGSETEKAALEQPASEPPASEESAREEPVAKVWEPGESASEPAADPGASEQEWASQAPAQEEPATEVPAAEEASSDHAEDSEAKAIPPSLAQQLHSGMPFEALEQILLLSSGDAQAASRSAVTSGMLEAAAGEDLNVIREKIPRDAMGGCVFLEKLRGGGSIPEVAWRAASTLKPEVVRQAREGLYRICIRTYPIETGEMVALFLFYNKQML